MWRRRRLKGYQFFAGSFSVFERRPSTLTGLDELTLGTAATWQLTAAGYVVAAAARRHIADGGSIASLPDVLFPQPH